MAGSLRRMLEFSLAELKRNYEGVISQMTIEPDEPTLEKLWELLDMISQVDAQLAALNE